MEMIGALPMDTFYPRKDRMKLVMELNALVASPAFAAWTQGIPLDMAELLGSDDSPRASIISVAHLDDRQRQFILGLLVSELVSWMRRQPGSSGLRALLYMDEVHGILPPHPYNPPTKGPLLTLLKQGRAFGVGAWLATQNPVDIDYKAAGNAGVKVVGRLITERDRDRVLDGLGLDELDDGSSADEVVTTLGKRQFLLYDVPSKQRTRTFSSRWAMSYLRGPVTLAEMAPLVTDRAVRAPSESSGEVPVRSRATEGSPTPPVFSVDTEQKFVVGASQIAEPALLVKNRLSVRRVTLGLDRRFEEVWKIPVDQDGSLAWDSARVLDQIPDMTHRPPAGMLFPRAVPTGLDRDLRKAGSTVVSWRGRRSVEVLANRTMKMAAAPGEERAAFEARCLEAADRADDAAQDRARTKFERKMQTLRKRLARERHELETDRSEARSRKAEEFLGVVEGPFSVLLGSRSVSSASRKATSRMKSAATRRRMSSKAGADVVESEDEIIRIEEELEDLAEDLQDEVDRIAEASEEKALQIEEVGVRPNKTDIAVLDLFVLWE